MNPISCTLTDCISPLLCDVITWVHDCTAYKATHLTHQRETPPTAHPPFFLHLSGSSHNKKKKHRKWRPWTLDTGLSCCRSDQSTAEIPSYLSVTVCKQSATEHNQLVPNCLHYIISRRNLSLSNLGLSYRPPPPPVLIKEAKKEKNKTKTFPIRLGCCFLTTGSNVAVKTACTLSSLINLTREAGIKGPSIKDERIMYLICYI